MTNDFTHLHTHSVVSLLDGMSPLWDEKTKTKGTLAEKAAQMGQTALALTDHGNMYGMVKHHLACEHVGIKPIYGVEAYLMVGENLEAQKATKKRGFQHITLLAETDKGLQNLFALTTKANTEGFWYKPLTSLADLSEYSEGVIALSGCIQGPVAQALKAGDGAKARAAATWFKEVYGDRYYMELHEHGMPDQPAINADLIGVATYLGIRPVVANDSHYLNKSDAPLHDILLATQTGQRINDPNRGLSMVEWPEFYLKSREEMLAVMPVPAYLDRTLEIAERCTAKLVLKGREFPRPARMLTDNETEWLRDLAYKGAEEKYGLYWDRDDKWKTRIDYELKVINDLGYVRYFLIVADLMRFARESGIPSSARGSAAGSLVAYCLGITPVDPIAFNLVFERFLSPGRSPDIDLDFADSRRSEIMEYAARAYGEDRVAQIVTFGTIGGRSAIRDVARATGFPLDRTDTIAKLVPTMAELKRLDAIHGIDYKAHHELAAAIQVVPELQGLTGSAARVFKTALAMEGIKRQSGTHAGGMIIGSRPLVLDMALQRIKEEAKLLCTQIDMQDCEAMDFVKFDILGLANLSVVEECLRLIEENRGIKVDMREVGYDDPKTYELLSAGETHGTFQLESAGMRKHLKNLKPDRIGDIQAMVALYRPGPMDKIESFIARKNGTEAITYYDPILEPILEGTYGHLVYQEAIMFISQRIMGFNGVEADKFLYAVRKKVKERLAEYEPIWYQKASENGVARDVAEKLWKDIQPFANYGFNQAHAACYGVLAYQTAYLKANFTPEYMAALLSSESRSASNAATKLALAISDARRMGVAILTPDVNLSQAGFTVEDGVSVRFGLLAVKQLGQTVLNAILTEREKNGKFTDINEFRSRVRKADIRVVTNLVKAGAFDYCGTRALLLSELGKEAGKGRAGRLNDEREVLGYCLSEHAIAPFASKLDDEVTIHCAEIDRDMDGEPVTYAGVIMDFKEIATKKGDKMAMIDIEDETGQAAVTMFPAVWARYGKDFKKGRVMIGRGKVNVWMNEAKLTANSMSWVS